MGRSIYETQLSHRMAVLAQRWPGIAQTEARQSPLSQSSACTLDLRCVACGEPCRGDGVLCPQCERWYIFVRNHNPDQRCDCGHAGAYSGFFRFRHPIEPRSLCGVGCVSRHHHKHLGWVKELGQ
jgi:hypothetical protein